MEVHCSGAAFVEQSEEGAAARLASHPVSSASSVLKYIIQLRSGSGVAKQTQEVTAEELTWLSSGFCAHPTTTFKLSTGKKPLKSRLLF